MALDEKFQLQLAAHYLRDDVFVQVAGSLITPDYFDDATLGALVAVQGMYLTRYGQCCALTTFVQLINKAVAAKKVKIADMQEAKRLLAVLWKDPLKDRQFVIDNIVEFARLKALEHATENMIDALDAQDLAKAEAAIKRIDDARNLGATDRKEAAVFTKSRDMRAQVRKARLSGSASALGITTGSMELDSFLTPHKGWGRKELSILMGPPKRGKTAALVNFARAAAEAGYRVFYASCEVGELILGDRLEACISGIKLAHLATKEQELDQALSAWVAKTTGEIYIQEFPIRTLKVSALRRILKGYEAKGITFDLVIVDYGDIMAPEVAKADARFEISEIYRNLRALAQEMDFAMLTATQTNRSGTAKAGKSVTTGVDVAEDYEKVRVADVLITINQSDEEREAGEVVLYFSEMRNAETGLRFRFAQDLSCMRFMTKFIGMQ